jgi:hypothetical protein
LAFAREVLSFCFLAVGADLFFFLRGMSLIILPHENFCFAEMFLLVNRSANLLPIIPTSFQQFSEKQCGKPQGTIEAMQQSCVF